MDNTYIIVLSQPNKNGEQSRLTSYLVGPHGKNIDAVKEKAAAAYPGHDTVQGGEDIQFQFTSGKVYKKGKYIAPQPIAPTAAELTEQQRTELNAEYKAAKDELQQSYLAALLADNTAAAESIKEESADLDAAYIEQLQELNKEA